ncbi:hypothetical protein, partial [Klebsiella pneumoniae]|uniref:hypothetical protein n=1 Tax=Klebsiella pneumoniae TaxID=573 RepID=UPI0017FA6D82
CKRPTLTDKTVTFNGRLLKLGTNDEMPTMDFVPTKTGKLVIEPANDNFLSLPSAGNETCNGPAP